MNVIHLFLLIHGAAATVEQAPHFKIAGGEIVEDITEFPYQVSLRVGWQHVCGGVIYNDRHVLTAAHCLIKVPTNKIMIVAGIENFMLPTPGMDATSAADIYIHEEYNTSNNINDIAIIKTKHRFLKTQFVEPIPLWTNRTPPETTDECIVSGWGNSKIGERVSKELQWVEAHIFETIPTCRKVYGSLLKNGMLCAGMLEGGKSACQGDSGGPLACNGQLIGLVSWSYDCGRPNYPTVYTNVTHYLKWIEETVARSSCNKLAPSLLITIIFLMNK